SPILAVDRYRALVVDLENVTQRHVAQDYSGTYQLAHLENAHLVGRPSFSLTWFVAPYEIPRDRRIAR
ncbi:MAG: hypothetical protein V3T12_00570, partial [Acidiferrobacterales bacterium]